MEWEPAGLVGLPRGFRRSDEEIFCRDSPCGSRTLRRRYTELVGSPVRCAICRLGTWWNGVPLTLQLDHANGINDDNRLINLRWLCPNCHSQTPTFGGRNQRRVA